MQGTYLDEGAHQNSKIGEMIAKALGLVMRSCSDLTTIRGPVSGIIASRNAYKSLFV